MLISTQRRQFKKYWEDFETEPIRGRNNILSKMKLKKFYLNNKN